MRAPRPVRLLLLVGAVSGAQLGVRAVVKLPAAQLRGLLAPLVVAVSINIAYELTATPANPYTVAPLLEPGSPPSGANDAAAGAPATPR